MSTVSSPPTLSNSIKAGIARRYSALESPWKMAVLANYEGARQSRAFDSPTRVGSNPNSTIAQLQRTKLSLQGEEIIKNTAFGRNYVNKRRMYCSSGISWHPDTGNPQLNKLVSDYCEDQWKRMGVNASMQQTFSLCADAFLPQYGDCALRWIRSEEGNPNSDLRLLAITGDRIGEVYRYVAPVVKDGITYYCGLFFRGPNIIKYRIYERWYDTTYIRPENVDAEDVIYFIDDISGGVRGVSIFAAAVDDVRSRHEILKSTKDTMQQQSKIAAIASNNAGQPLDYSYETQQNANGTIEYVEQFADGAVVKYQFNGDSYQVMRAEHPSSDFLGALRYLDANGSLACGFPYEFLFSGSESGGAPFRGAFEAAGREITRLRNEVYRPRLDVIAYVTIMDGVERKLLPPAKNITRGSWQFTTLPTADAFRDDKSDIAAIRAGINSPQRVIANNLGTTADAILSETKTWAVMVAKATEDANRELVKLGYKPTVTPADIAQVTDNPQQAAQAENLIQGKPTSITDNGDAPQKPSAAMAEHDVSDEKRDDDGKWTSGGAKNAPKAERNESAKNNLKSKQEDVMEAARLPEELRGKVRDWQVLSKSPFSNSLYDITNKSFGPDPHGHERIADHWNWKFDPDDEHIHGRTDIPVPDRHWAHGVYDADAGLYRIKQIVPHDTRRDEFEALISTLRGGGKLHGIKHAKAMAAQRIERLGLDIVPPKNASEFQRVKEQVEQEYQKHLDSKSAGGAGGKTIAPKSE